MLCTWAPTPAELASKQAERAFACTEAHGSSQPQAGMLHGCIRIGSNDPILSSDPAAELCGYGRGAVDLAIAWDL